MTDFIYTTSTTIDRPVFIEADKLEALDKLLDEEQQRLHEYNIKRLDAEVEKEVNSAYGRLTLSVMSRGEADPEEVRRKHIEETRRRLHSTLRESRNLTIYLKGKKTVVPSFGEALRQQALLDELPVGFQVELRSGDIRCDIELRRPGALGSGGGLSISVYPEHLPEARELFASLQRWATPVRAPAWQRWWVKLHPVQWLLYVSMVFIVGSAISGSGRVYREQAVELLKDGLTPDEQLKATQLILLLEAELVPSDQAKLPSWFWFLLFGGLALCIVLSITPSSVLGIGKGEVRIKHWRTWIRIVFIFTPGFIFAQIIMPYLLRWLGVS